MILLIITHLKEILPEAQKTFNLEIQSKITDPQPVPDMPELSTSFFR